MISLLRRLVLGVDRNRTVSWELIGEDSPARQRSLDRVPRLVTPTGRQQWLVSTQRPDFLD